MHENRGQIYQKNYLCEYDRAQQFSLFLLLIVRFQLTGARIVFFENVINEL